MKWPTLFQFVNYGSDNIQTLHILGWKPIITFHGPEFMAGPAQSLSHGWGDVSVPRAALLYLKEVVRILSFSP